MLLHDLTYMMEQWNLITYHHVYLLLWLWFQATYNGILLLGWKCHCTQATAVGILFNRSLLHPGFELVANALMKISRLKSLLHHTSKLLPTHCHGIPSLYTKTISCLTYEVHYSSGGMLIDWHMILHLEMEVCLKEPCIQYSCVQITSKGFW